MRRTVAFAVALLVAVSAAPALASPDTPEDVPVVDVSARRDRLIVLDDGAGHLVVVDPEALDEATFFGDRTHLWRLQVYSASAEEGRSFDVTALDFRARDGHTSVSWRDGAYAMECEGATRALRRLPNDEARAVVRAATFHEHRWRRNAVGFYRDEYGVYYFIDRATGDDEDADHRVYVGWRGQMLRSPMTLLASDTLGRVYAAANGTRRLVLTRGEARYVEDTVERRLYELDLTRDGPLAYGPLGVYGDAPHGTPCDVVRR